MKRFLFLFVMISLLVILPSVLGSDLDDFKAHVEKEYEAFNNQDAATIATMVHPGFVMFDRDSAFADVIPMEGIEALILDSTKNWFATLESLQITPINMQYRVIGNTGIAWGHETMIYKPKDGSIKTIQSRITATYMKSDGKWRILILHSSAIPSGD